MNDIKRDVKRDITIVVTGDFNHVPEFFASDLAGSGLDSYAPSESTMGGPDFRGAVKDKTVDFALANQPFSVTRIEPDIRPEPSLTANIPITAKLGNVEITLARCDHHFTLLETYQKKAEEVKNEWKLHLTEYIAEEMPTLGVTIQNEEASKLA